MGWWRKPTTGKQDRKPGPAPHDAPHTEPHEERDVAYEVIASILRSVGESVFDVGDDESTAVRRAADAWAQHVLVAAPAPGTEDPNAGSRRYWGGVRRFVGQQLSHRSELFDKVTADLRDVVQAFVGSIGKVMVDTDRSDREVLAQIGRLREAAQTESLDRLRDDVMSVASQVSEAVETRQRSQRDHVARLTERIHDLRAELQTAQRESEIDPLTNLANRRAFDQYVAATVDFARLTGAAAALLFVDIDHFKQVNDRYGHDGGDAALRRLADELMRTFPRRGDFIARYGGEEFCVVLREADAASVPRLAQRLLDSVNKVSMQHEGRSFRLTVSIGVSLLEFGDEPKDWVSRADAAMYVAKNSGRARYHLAGDEGASQPSRPVRPGPVRPGGPAPDHAS